MEYGVWPTSGPPISHVAHFLVQAGHFTSFVLWSVRQSCMLREYHGLDPIQQEDRQNVWEAYCMVFVGGRGGGWEWFVVMILWGFYVGSWCRVIWFCNFIKNEHVGHMPHLGAFCESLQLLLWLLWGFSLVPTYCPHGDTLPISPSIVPCIPVFCFLVSLLCCTVCDCLWVLAVVIHLFLGLGIVLPCRVWVVFHWIWGGFSMWLASSVDMWTCQYSQVPWMAWCTCQQVWHWDIPC